ncbi:MAG: ATP-binding cassette domain-containing protein [Candidatus Latescibacterota bacterium]|nr:MAG: ATP-binding cassette domain-containing protein [Candidatus Latescibacterota bacterium]
MINLINITVSLPPGSPEARTILKNVSLSVQKGDWLALVGPNGSGKSTLLKTLAGLWPVESGSLEHDNVGVDDEDESPRGSNREADRAAASGPVKKPTMALLLQEPDNQFVASSVRNELLLSLSPRYDHAQRAKMLTLAIERFSLGSFLDRNPHELSGGEKQRLALATVWLADPDLLLLDEPTSYLDPVERRRCIDFVVELNRTGVGVIWATPGGEELREAKRVAYIQEGAILFDGAVERFVLAAKEHDYDTLLPDESPFGVLDKEARGRDGGLPDRESVSAESRETVISLRDASFAYADQPVLDRISTDICVGECVGIAGRNGTGKTTFLSLLSGVLQPSGGSVYRKYPRAVDRTRRTGRPEQMVFHLFQNPERLFFAETVFEEIAFGLKSLRIGRLELPDVISNALTRVGLEPVHFSKRSPFSLSLGEMRRLAFAMALSLKPRFLLLDEPTSCLDTTGHRILYDVIEESKSASCTVVIASHDKRLLDRLTDRILEIENGRFV